MTPKEFRKYLDRDLYCLHCGDTETLVPNHRANRGMGGSKKRDVPSNIVVLCALLNGQIEGSHHHAKMAHAFGWKLSSWENPLEMPVWDSMAGVWYRLDDSYRRVALPDFFVE